jgi:hypothetical protein
MKPLQIIETNPDYVILKLTKEVRWFLKWLDDAKINKKPGIEYSIVFNSFVDPEDATIRLERKRNIDAFDLLVTYFNGSISLSDTC